MAGQCQSQRLEKQLFLLSLINPAVMNRDVQGLLQRDHARLSLRFAVRAEGRFDPGRHRQAVERELVGLLDAEVLIHVFDQRRFSRNDSVGFLVRCSAIVLGGAAGQEKQKRR